MIERTKWPKRMVLDAIRPEGSTASEIAQAVGIPRSTLSVRLVAYQRSGFIHISGRRRTPGTRGNPAAIYKLCGS